MSEHEFPNGQTWGIGHAACYLIVNQNAVTPYLFASNGDVQFDDPWRPIAWKTPFDKKTYVEEYAGLKLGEEEYPTEAIEETVERARTFDRVLLMTPPPKVLEAFQKSMDVEGHVDTAWVLRPRAI